jgi:hypothetical protein
VRIALYGALAIAVVLGSTFVSIGAALGLASALGGSIAGGFGVVGGAYLAIAVVLWLAARRRAPAAAPRPRDEQ